MPKHIENTKLLNDYIKSLDKDNVKAYKIAVELLQTSFNIEKSIFAGFSYITIYIIYRNYMQKFIVYLFNIFVLFTESTELAIKSSTISKGICFFFLFFGGKYKILNQLQNHY